jgi:hypothetical protein
VGRDLVSGDAAPDVWRLSLVRGREGLQRERFLEHWLGPHREHVTSIDGVVAARFYVVESWTPGHAAWDGLGLVGFRSGDDARTAFDAPEARSWIADERARYFGAVENALLRER